MRPLQAHTQGQAIRMFADLANDPQSEVGKHPQDYSLFWIADFNDADASFETGNGPKCLARAHEVKTNQLLEQKNNED